MILLLALAASIILIREPATWALAIVALVRGLAFVPEPQVDSSPIERSAETRAALISSGILLE